MYRKLRFSFGTSPFAWRHLCFVPFVYLRPRLHGNSGKCQTGTKNAASLAFCARVPINDRPLSRHIEDDGLTVFLPAFLLFYSLLPTGIQYSDEPRRDSHPCCRAVFPSDWPTRCLTLRHGWFQNTTSVKIIESIPKSLPPSRWNFIATLVPFWSGWEWDVVSQEGRHHRADRSTAALPSPLEAVIERLHCFILYLVSVFLL